MALCLRQGTVLFDKLIVDEFPHFMGHECLRP